MNARAYDAILLDLDGTLVADDGTIHPETRRNLHAAAEAGVTVMIATGRSEATAVPVIEALGIHTPAVIYNGAAVYCPEEQRLLEERNLPRTMLEDLLDFAERFGKRGGGVKPPTTTHHLQSSVPANIELFAMQQLAEQGADAWHVENAFPRTLTALAFWDVLFAPVPGVIGTLMAVEALKFLAGIDQEAIAIRLFDAAGGNWQSIGIKKREDCPACGGRR